MTSQTFIIEAPHFAPGAARATFRYRLGDLAFTEILDFPSEGLDAARADDPAFAHVLALTAAVLGVSYYKLTAPLAIDATALALSDTERAFVLDVYENGLGEFFARNDLKRFGRIAIESGGALPPPSPADPVSDRALVLIGGGKDSLVSLELLEAAEIPLSLFAVNPKGPIRPSAERAQTPLLAVTRTLDPDMIRLSQEPGYYNGHVPSTAINSMIAALACLLYGYTRIVLSNERSASEGNLAYDGRVANHQYSKSLDFETALRTVLHEASGGTLDYFSLLRPFSEARIAALFARQTRFDGVFSSCNRNFRLSGHDGPLWCGECPKCHFVFLIFAPAMERDRLETIFGRNLLDDPAHIPSYREHTGLSGHKPWECVGEILESAACLWALTDRPEWRDAAVVKALKPELEAFYGAQKLEAAYRDLFVDSPEHLIPRDIADRVSAHAH